MIDIGNKPTQRDRNRALLVKKTAEHHGVTRRQIYRVTEGERNDEEIMNTYDLSRKY